MTPLTAMPIWPRAALRRRCLNPNGRDRRTITNKGCLSESGRGTNVEDYFSQKKRRWLRLREQTGKLNEMSCHHKKA